MKRDAYVFEATLSEKTADWLSQVHAYCTPRLGLRLDISRCALLVMDMQAYFAKAGHRCFLPSTTAIVPSIQRLIALWRHQGRPVIYTAHSHNGQGDLGMMGLFFNDYIKRGTPEAEIIEALAPMPGEAVIPKITYDGFLNTDLENRLRVAACDQVLITGALTHMCCETTARSAFCRGFEVYVAADATAANTEPRHLTALKAMADTVAVITSGEAIVNACRKI